MKSADEKLIDALEAYVAFRESDETWTAEFKSGAEEMRQNFKNNLPLSMERVSKIREYASEKRRQTDISKEILESTLKAAVEKAARLTALHTARANALSRLSEALIEKL